MRMAKNQLNAIKIMYFTFKKTIPSINNLYLLQHWRCQMDYGEED
jgi:hypothetical protein